jgi:serine/threonine protein kinase
MTCVYKILGVGSYSIVITPTISSHITEVKKYENPQKDDVCKIFKTDEDCLEDFNDEILILNKISSIPNYTDFTVEYKGASIFNISQISHDNKILKHIMKDNYYSLYQRMFSSTYKKLYQITFEYGGICINQLNDKIDFKLFIEVMLQLYKGILILHQNDIVHRDLKPTNILFHEKKIKIIDFGLACHVDEVYDYKKSNFLLDCNYPFNPPEFYMASHLLKNQHKYIDKNSSFDFEKCLEDTFSIFRADNESFKQYYTLHSFESLDISIYSYIFAFKEILKEIKEKNYQNINEIFTRDLVYKADIFSSSFIIKSLKKRIIFQNNDQIEFHETLYKMTHNLNPFQRSDIYHILQFLESWNSFQNCKK